MPCFLIFSSDCIAHLASLFSLCVCVCVGYLRAFGVCIFRVSESVCVVVIRLLTCDIPLLSYLTDNTSEFSLSSSKNVSCMYTTPPKSHPFTNIRAILILTYFTDIPLDPLSSLTLPVTRHSVRCVTMEHALQTWWCLLWL